MKNFWGIVPRYIKSNKKRVLSMSVGIILSVILIMSLVMAKEAYVNTSIESNKNKLGAFYDSRFQTENKLNLSKFKDDKAIKESTTSLILGYTSIENTDYDITITGYEDNIIDFMNAEFIEGRKPNSDNEIALEEWMIPYFSKDLKVGDKIKLKYQLEYLTNVNEQAETVESEFTLVGIFKYTSTMTGNNSTGIGWVTKDFAQKQLKNKTVRYEGYINFNKTYSIYEGNAALIDSGIYTDVYFMPNVEKNDMQREITNFEIMCIGLLIVFGVVVSINIYNIFSVSVMERRRDIGILRALGATPGRIKLLIIIEGLIIGIISIPIGIVIGNIMGKGVMVILGYEEVSSLLTVSKLGIILSIVVGFFAILIGTYFPAIKASKITPLEAINENNKFYFKGSVHMENHARIGMKTKFVRAMAFTNLRRSRKKFITSTLSLSVIIFLLMVTYYVINQVDPLEVYKSFFGGSDFIVVSENGYGMTEEVVNKLSKVEGAKVGSKTTYAMANFYIDKDKVLKDGQDYFKSLSGANPSLMDLYEKGVCYLPGRVYRYDDEALKKISNQVKAGNLNDTTYEPMAILVQNMNGLKYSKISVGDEIEVFYDKFDETGESIGAGSLVVKVGAILDEDKFFSPDGKVSISLILGDKDASKYFGMGGYQTINMNIEKNVKYEKAYENLIKATENIRSASVWSFKEKCEEIKSQNAQLRFVLYSFIFIVALVSMINLVNIMKMNVITRMKEIGMLRAVGLSTDEVKSMLKIEGAIYGITASLIGCTFGVLGTFLIYKCNPSLTWRFPLINIIIITIVTVMITILASVISSRDLFKSSIVSSIRSIE